MLKLALLAALAATPAAQVTGHFRSFGVGCPAASPALLFSATPYPPTVGKSYSVGAFGGRVGSGVGGLGLGLSNTSFMGLPLPIDLGVIGMPSCSLYHSYEDQMSLVYTTIAFTATFQIPYDPALVGAVLYLQAHIISWGSNARGVVTTNAAELRIGN